MKPIKSATFYRCNACHKIFQRMDLGWKLWTPSYCEVFGRMARLYRISVPTAVKVKTLKP